MKMHVKLAQSLLSFAAPSLRSAGIVAHVVSMASASSASQAAASVVQSVGPLSFPLSPPDPFLFCAYHLDRYPAGDSKMQAPRRGNGADFGNSDYNMYHGDRIPGFPGHPHRGFETLTVTLEGITDHADSAGNSGRYGQGDLQWLTAGGGIQHSEMFPLIHSDRPNTLKLFQIWLNLPKRDKMAPPCFIMHWAEDMVKMAGAGGATATLVAGKLGATDSGCTPPPHSWARDPAHDVAVAVLSLPPGGSSLTLPPSPHGAQVNRVLYVTDGRGVTVGGTRLTGPAAVTLRADGPCEVVNGDATAAAQALLLQGRPIREPVAQTGPFVMNTQAEIMEAYRDYQRTEFGGWPWGDGAQRDVAFPASTGRFASYKQPDGSSRVEYPPSTDRETAKSEL